MSGFTGDLLVIVPSRNRPENIARLLKAVHETSIAQTHVHVCVDEDDPALADYERVMADDAREDDHLERGRPRKGLAAWSNEVALRRAPQYPYLASFGDDMIPRTPGWDKALLRAISDMPGGTGFSYPWDSVREDIPEAVVMSSDIVSALGWMCEPSLNHWYVDNVWADLGRGAGRLQHCRVVAVDHVKQGDQTAEESMEKLAADRDAYYRWRRTRMADDIKKIIALCKNNHSSKVPAGVPG